MKLSEAYEALGLTQNATLDEAKKQYKLLVKKWHPDSNQSPEAPGKIKNINEAYECVKSGKGNEREVPRPQHNPFYRQRQIIQLENVEINLTIDFKESVLGCKKEVKYSRQAKCQACDGAGEVRLDNGCTRCGGKGQTTIKQRGMIFISTCPQCGGRSPTEHCKSCNGESTVHTDVSVHVSVPAGILNGTTLRLQGMGNYAGSVMGLMDQYTDAFCHIMVKPEAELSIEGKSVVSNLTLSLLDAIRGCKCSVKTIYGSKEIQIPSQSRNQDEVIIPHCGVGGTGDQRVVLDVQYPKNTDKLIGALVDDV